MTYLDPQLVSLSYLIRWLHVAAMAGLFGGALLIWAVALQSPASGDGDRGGMLLVIAQAYEWIFWVAFGLLVMSGVGNLGTFGAALPDSGTDWGGKLIIKLAIVGAFMLLSLVRTLLVVVLGVAPDRRTSVHRKIVQWAYAGTVLLAAAIVGVAVSLAHG